MKPSYQEVFHKILQLYAVNAGKIRAIQLTDLAEQLDTCRDDIMPSLLLLVREQVIKFESVDRSRIVLVNRKHAA